MHSVKISQWKIKLIYVFFIAAVICVVAFLFRWQIIEYDRYRILANQRVKDSQLASLRGTILDAKGSPLAYSIPVYDVFVYIPEIEYAEELGRQSRNEFIGKVSKTLDIKKQELEKQLSSTIIYYIIARDIPSETKEHLEILRKDKYPDQVLEGLHFEPSEKRIYPDNTLASQVIGFVGKNNLGKDVGRNGIEGYWNGDLAWKSGFIIEETDSFGNQILTGKYEPIYPKIGRSLKLTIDRGIQEVIERKIKEGVTRWNAESGTILVMNPRTGEVIGMANYPTYNPNKYWKVKDYSVYQNKAVSDSYEFGSVGKSFTAAAAIDSKKATPTTEIFDHHEGCIHVLAEKEICTSSREPSGAMNLTQVLAYSDNIGAFLTAERVGKKKMHNYLKEFGFGKKTNVGLAEESTSILKDGSKWNRADLAAYSYGQGYSATPIQIVSGLSAIPNKGLRMQPFIVSKIYDEEEVIEIKPRIASKPIKKTNAIVVNAMLVKVFEGNGSRWYYPEVDSYRLAGKSGTAQVLADNALEYATDKVNVTFVGWDANDQSKFIMLVKLEEPAGAPYSVDSAQPLWVETFLELKDLLGVVPKDI